LSTAEHNKLIVRVISCNAALTMFIASAAFSLLCHSRARPQYTVCESLQAW